eukprot:5448533-Pleurochrysis_carterae.AAC.3
MNSINQTRRFTGGPTRAFARALVGRFSVPATCSESSPREVMEQIAKSALGGPDASRSTSATEEPVDNLFGDFAIM